MAMRFLKQIMDDPEAAIAQYAKIGETNGGKILNTDPSKRIKNTITLLTEA